jgi:hypothetical protein
MSLTEVPLARGALSVCPLGGPQRDTDTPPGLSCVAAGGARPDSQHRFTNSFWGNACCSPSLPRDAARFRYQLISQTEGHKHMNPDAIIHTMLPTQSAHARLLRLTQIHNQSVHATGKATPHSSTVSDGFWRSLTPPNMKPTFFTCQLDRNDSVTCQLDAK